MIVHLTKYSGDPIKNEMGGVCGTHGGRRAVHTEFWCGNRRKRDHLEDLSEDGRMILK